MDQKRTNEDQMIEWMAAGSSFGLSSPLEPMIEIRRHERGANDTYEKEWITEAGTSKKGMVRQYYEQRFTMGIGTI